MEFDLRCDAIGGVRASAPQAHDTSRVQRQHALCVRDAVQRVLRTPFLDAIEQSERVDDRTDERQVSDGASHDVKVGRKPIQRPPRVAPSTHIGSKAHGSCRPSSAWRSTNERRCQSSVGVNVGAPAGGRHGGHGGRERTVVMKTIPLVLLVQDLDSDITISWNEIDRYKESAGSFATRLREFLDEEPVEADAEGFLAGIVRKLNEQDSQ